MMMMNYLDDPRPCLCTLLVFELPSMMYIFDAFAMTSTPRQIHGLLEPGETQD